MYLHWIGYYILYCSTSVLNVTRLNEVYIIPSVSLRSAGMLGLPSGIIFSTESSDSPQMRWEMHAENMQRENCEESIFPK